MGRKTEFIQHLPYLQIEERFGDNLRTSHDKEYTCWDNWLSFCSKNRIPQSGQLMRNRNVFLKVLEATKSKSKATASLVSPQDLPFLVQYDNTYSLAWQKEWQGPWTRAHLRLLVNTNVPIVTVRLIVALILWELSFHIGIWTNINIQSIAITLIAFFHLLCILRFL